MLSDETGMHHSATVELPSGEPSTMIFENKGALRQQARPLGYDESVARDIVRQCSEEEFFADALPPTDDDVPIALDGRVLDSPEKVIAYLDEINSLQSHDRG